MIFEIKINIELSTAEIAFLREKFNIKSAFNVFFKHPPYVRDITNQLIHKEILCQDHIGNVSLTLIGHSVMNKIDRDKIIDNLLDGTGS